MSQEGFSESEVRAGVLQMLHDASINVDGEVAYNNGFEALGVSLDSLAMLQIVIGLENRFGVEVQPEDVGQALFRSPQSLAEFVLRRQKAGG